MRRLGMAAGAVFVSLLAALSAADQPVTPTNEPPLPTTFLAGEAAGAWTGVSGEWEAPGIRVLFAPRAARAGEQKVALSGFIPGGSFEGVLLFEPAPDADAVDAGGIFVEATGRLARAPARLRGTAERLELTIGAGPPLTLRRRGPANLARLAKVGIIAHRGLSLGEPGLMNSVRAVEHAWMFGASGVEVDVTVPYAAIDRGRAPQTRELRVLHPPVVRSELTGFDSVEIDAVAAAPTLARMFDAVISARLPLVYVDPKLRWLVTRHPAAAVEALDRIAQAAAAVAASSVGTVVLVGAETEEAAGFLAAGRVSLPAGVGWVDEWTRGRDPARLLERASGAAVSATALSFNLLRLRGGSGGLLGLFLRDLSGDWEARYRRLPQPFIYWTAESPGQIQGAIDALARMSGTPRSGAIVTPVPHRAVVAIATDPD